MRITCALIFLFTSSVNGLHLDLREARTLYQKSASEENACKVLIAGLEEYNENNNPTLGGYKAVATMILAKYKFNPITKLANFNQGKFLLEKCIKADNKNTELHYLRFTIQSSAPSFLGYTDEIQGDKIYLINSISIIKDTQLKQMIISFLMNSENLTTIEKKYLMSRAII